MGADSGNIAEIIEFVEWVTLASLGFSAGLGGALACPEW
jgi:hypothetical protein